MVDRDGSAMGALQRSAAVTGPLVGAAFLGGVGTAVRLSDHPYPRPGADADAIRTYFTDGARGARISATGQLVSAAALAAFSGAVAQFARRPAGRRLRRRRHDAAGDRLATAAVAGGALASASLAAAGLHALALTTGRAAEPERAIVLHRRAFLAGGPTHGVGFGILVGALGLAGLRGGGLPRPLAIAAVATAVPNMLAPLYLVVEPAGWLIPIGRFPGLIISGAAGVHIARTA
jgi:hypothetical protein